MAGLYSRVRGREGEGGEGMCRCVYSHVCIHEGTQGKTNGSTQSSYQFSKKKVSCLEKDSNPRSPAYMTGALPTKPAQWAAR